MSRDTELAKRAYTGRIILDSENYENIAFEIKRYAIEIKQWDGRTIRSIRGTIADMEIFAQELLEVCREWKSIRT